VERMKTTGGGGGNDRKNVGGGEFIRRWEGGLEGGASVRTCAVGMGGEKVSPRRSGP